jgi:hypothetical protein
VTPRSSDRNADKLDAILLKLGAIEKLIEQHILKPGTSEDMDLADFGLPLDSEEDLQVFEEKLSNKDFRTRMVCMTANCNFNKFLLKCSQNM